MREARHEGRKTRSWRFRSPHGRRSQQHANPQDGVGSSGFVGNIVPSGRFELPTCGLGNRRSVHTELRGQDNRRLAIVNRLSRSSMNVRYGYRREKATSWVTPTGSISPFHGSAARLNIPRGIDIADGVHPRVSTCAGDHPDAPDPGRRARSQNARHDSVTSTLKIPQLFRRIV